MLRSPRLKTALVAVATLLVPALAGAASGYLSGPAAGSPRDVAMAYLDAHRDELGLTASDLADLVVSDQYATRHNGLTHIYLVQRLGGVEVARGIFNLSIDRQGRVLYVGNRLVPDLAGKVNAQAPAITPEAAILAAADHLGLVPSGEPQMVTNLGGPAREAIFGPTGLSRREIPVQLRYYPLASGEVRLAWDLVIDERVSSHWWNLWVDAETGAVLDQQDWTNQATYRVYAFPHESPDDGARTDEIDPQDATASPFGWHDTNGAAGAEFTDTRGNNVFAQDDLDANDTGGSRPDGGAGLVFQPAIDLTTQQPPAYLDATIVNLFYWNNIIHDVFYQYGFDEPAGNFQANNYGNGGAGNDQVNADAQDGSGTNNANFSTPPDGSAPRMQMYVWTSPFPNLLTVNSPGPIAGDYQASGSAFGPPFTVPGTTADLQVANDGTANPTQACSALVGFTPGRMAVIDRANCNFTVKVKNAQLAGAVAVVMVNHVAGPPITMGGTDATITIPSLMISLSDGALIKGQLPSPGVNATGHDVSTGTLNRDSDLDAGVITHEYGHGVSNRLTGGPANVGCLFGNEQGGEGWSDFQALFLTAKASETKTTPRGIGNYVSYQDAVTGVGIRQFPYTTDLGVNPHTYSQIGGLVAPHGVGSVWAAMLWEVYWKLVGAYGYDPDLYGGSGGNNLAFQLVIDGMKMQPCGPTFLTARDAILAADVADNGGANQCLIWRGFAKRGAGFNAQNPDGTATGGEVDGFALPPSCIGIFSDGFESGNTSAWSVTIP